MSSYKHAYHAQILAQQRARAQALQQQQAKAQDHAQKQQEAAQQAAAEAEDEGVGASDEIDTYADYEPAKVKLGRRHPGAL
jgi:hypothetical protein